MSLFGPRVLTVSGMTMYLRALLESDEILRDIWVEGEISTLSKPSSGHIYFTLKDNAATLRCVIWKANAMRLRAALETGMAVEVHGAVSVYDAGGQYQLYVDAVRMAGEGYLFQEFMRLKALLENEGLFDVDRKREIPAFPRKIGVVTSPTGAALQDILNTIQGRFPMVEVVLAPTMVQGEEAPPKIVKAIRRLNQIEDIDVIILARGGGSMEDLWAFNDERVVRAVAESRIPIVTGVGHETDTTLADYAADYRAPTPTGAAVYVTPAKEDLLSDLDDLRYTLDTVMGISIREKQQLLSAEYSRLNFLSPRNRILNDQQRLDEIVMRMDRNFTHQLALSKSGIHSLVARLNSVNPLNVLQRGFAIVSDSHGKILSSVASVKIGDSISVRMVDGKLETEVKQIDQET
ncbi:MAG TPA: exodeoxyribonuclease VII large subunit [Anaerolineaceae bacterium]|nr:exodeoxyribonuclease VII large subunit [Anaerolineaceae bacterium]